MGRLISDDVLNAVAIVDEPDRVGGALLRRFGDVVTRMTLHMPYVSDTELGPRIAADVHSVRNARGHFEEGR